MTKRAKHGSEQRALSQKLKPVGTVRVNVYPLLCDAVERGVAFGWNRAHKHDEKPGQQALTDAMANAVLGELCELFVFDDYPEGGT